jgi:hypothetical protein
MGPCMRPHWEHSRSYHEWESTTPVVDALGAVVAVASVVIGGHAALFLAVAVSDGDGVAAVENGLILVAIGLANGSVDLLRRWRRHRYRRLEQARRRRRRRWCRLADEDRAHGLARSLVGRFAHHDRRAVEAGQGLREGLGPQRALAVGQMRLLVAVRVADGSVAAGPLRS